MQPLTDGQPSAPANDDGYPRRWLAALVMIGAALMDMIDVTIVNVALPTMGRDLGASGTQLEWVISAYLLGFAAVLIIAGSLGDVFGRKRMFLIGITGFGAASLAAASAPDPSVLIIARAVQGVSAAVMMPQLLATFRAVFPAQERGKAFGMYGAILGFASALGLLLGGVLTDANLFGWSWRSIFVINVPVAVVSLVAGQRLIPETREFSAARPDIGGAVLLALAIGAVAYPLLEGRRLGWPVWVWFVLAGGGAALVALAVAEGRRQHARVAPLLRTPLFRIPAFSAGLIVQLAFAAGLQGLFLVYALWLQTGMRFTPLGAGFTSIAFSVGSFILAGPAIPLAQRYGRLVLVAGGTLMAVGAWAMRVGASHVHPGSTSWPVVPGLVIAGMGLSLLVIPLVNVVLAAVPVEAAGGASGTFNTAQQLGGALGVAVIGTVFFSRLDGHGHADAFRHSIPPVAGLFLLSALLSLILPRTAVEEPAA